MITDFKPYTANHHTLVETIAIARWCHTRKATLMAAAVEPELPRQSCRSLPSYRASNERSTEFAKQNQFSENLLEHLDSKLETKGSVENGRYFLEKNTRICVFRRCVVDPSTRLNFQPYTRQWALHTHDDTPQNRDREEADTATSLSAEVKAPRAHNASKVFYLPSGE
jgi:hypothetical protein